jgi:hypothetical protein
MPTIPRHRAIRCRNMWIDFWTIIADDIVLYVIIAAHITNIYLFKNLGKLLKVIK